MWLILLGLILGGVGGYAGSVIQEPVYEASALVFLSQPSRDQLSELGYLSGQQLMQTYSALLKTQPILDETANRLGYEVDADQISVSQLRDTQILTVVVEDIHPERTAAIANTLVEVLAFSNEALQSSRYSASEESLQTQIQIVDEQIQTLRTQLSETSLESFETQKTDVLAQIELLQSEIIILQLEIDEAASDAASVYPQPTPLSDEEKYALQEKQLQLEQKQGTLALYQQLYFNLLVVDSNGGQARGLSNDGTTETTLALYQQIYTNLLSNYEEVRLARLENTPTIVKVEDAVIPLESIRPNIITNTILGAVVGLMLTAGVVFLIEYLDDTVKTPEDVTTHTNLPVIGYISEMSSSNGGNGDAIYVGGNPRSPIAEAFRALRTNIEFSGITKELKTILVTSPGPGEGKSTVAVNLAEVMAQGDSKVLLIDADLRRPRLHQFFDVKNRVGLSEYFRSKAGLDEIAISTEKNKKLAIIPSGKLPPNPSELLGSDRFLSLLDEIKDSVDYLIIDSPPLVVTDAAVMASKVDGVILVIRPGVTKINALKSAIAQLENTHARVLGIVFNRISRQSAAYSHTYESYYRSNDYYEEEI